MNKIILLLCLCILAFNLTAATTFSCWFLKINPSARDAAFGLESGVAGLEYLSPATFANNPAKLGAFTGFSSEFASYNYSGGKFSSHNIALGAYGIGISLPMPTSKSSKFLYEKIEILSADGVSSGFYKPEETNNSYFIGIDFLQLHDLLFSRNQKSAIRNQFGFYAGYSHAKIVSELFPGSEYMNVTSGINVDGEANLNNYGLLLEFKPAKYNTDLSQLSFTGGLNIINSDKVKITYINSAQADLLPTGYKYGISGIYKQRLNSINWFTESFCPNLYSVYGSLDYADYYQDEKIFGFGAEITALDLVSVRLGRTERLSPHNTANTYSFGLNLNYQQLAKFKIDYTDTFGEEGLYCPAKTNYSLSFDFTKFIY